MDLKLIRILITHDSYYISDAINHSSLGNRLLRNGVGQLSMYKLRNNYHLGIL